MLKQELRMAALGSARASYAARPWIANHEQAAAPLAELTGAHDSEVVAMNSLTVICIDDGELLSARPRTQSGTDREIRAVPSDRYAVVFAAGFHG